MKTHINEAASQEAYALHRLTDCGQDAAQNFMDANPNVNFKKLMSDLVQDKAYRYIVKDIISGIADPVYVKQFTKKYGELGEANNPVSALVENVVSQTILEAFEPVEYNVNIHKTPETGAMDFTLMPDNETVEVTMPFKEEPTVQVAVPVKKEYFGDIESQDDLDNLEYSIAYRNVHDLFKRPDLFKKYVTVK